MRTFRRDVQFGMRLFRSHPGFTAVVVLTLALGIAANTTVFSWVDEVLLRPFPGASDGGRLAVLRSITTSAPNGGDQLSCRNDLDYRANLRSLAGLAVHNEEVFSLGEEGRSEAVWGELVSGNNFDVLGVRPALGRTLTPAEDGDKLGAYPVAVIGDGLRRRRFHADPRVIGTTLRVNQHEVRIVGVAPREFRGTMPGLVFDIWTPVTMARDLGMQGEGGFRDRDDEWLYAIARLKPGVSVEQASAAAWRRRFPKPIGEWASIVPVWEFPSAAPGLFLKPLRILMAISLLLMLIVCANVANLLLARSVARRRELSIRLAIGAQASHLGRQLFTETMLLAGAASMVGVLLVSWMADALPSMVPKIGVHVALGSR
jgi:predicted permease